MTLKEALKIVVKDEFLSDSIYQVKERARESDDDFEGNSWEHPRVVRFAEAVKVLEEYLNE